MNGPRAFCPRCKKDVLFAQAGGVRRCTVCGWEFELTEPPAPVPEWVEATVMTVGHVLLRVFIILGVILLLGVAVLFATCALHSP
jgi:uncharacterized protein (DUF983 family)